MSDVVEKVSALQTAGLASVQGTVQEVLAQFAKAGIDVDAVAAQLQEEGAKSFVKSWEELMGVITSKSSALKEAAAS